MAIRILMILFSTLLFINGFYFLTHLNKPFLMFHPEKYRSLSLILLISGIIILLVAILALISAFVDTQLLIISSLFLGCMCAFIPELFIIQYMNK
ncbi:hypothetical protein GSH19_06440 [Lactobacillus sp. S2-2]|uniref:hypothetical protein n=1 Tax=Lactobacillus sp. S2-2 TaxID=2692917 RepID=UPI001F1DD1B6|nr:hypothetical protein [Lactobacillus sp. S2-2]MCF6515781.1 hypothetical protein [Lactobacillus sp. S2-2]